MLVQSEELGVLLEMWCEITVPDVAIARHFGLVEQGNRDAG